jgi:hypothetical protein
MKNTTVFHCNLITLPKNHMIYGNLTSVNNLIEVPFEIKRVYYLYDIPGGLSRGGHAHKDLQQLIIALSGSFDLIVDDGKVKRTFNLTQPNKGVYMPAGLWRDLDNFSSGSICMVLASLEYSEDDYIRDYEEFKIYKL